MNYKSFSIIIFVSISAFLFFSPIIVNADDCSSVPKGGDYIVSSSCSFSGTVNGVDAGGITVDTNQVLLVNDGQTIAWGPGESIVINGSITITNGGQLKQTYLWMLDSDNDGYPASTTQVAADNQTAAGGSTYKQRSNLNSYTAVDVNESSNTTWQYLDCYTDADSDDYALAGGTASTESGADCPAGKSLTTSGTDCLDSDADVYRDVTNLADDTDQDRWYTGSLATRCVGAKSSYWYKDAGGSYKWLSSDEDLGTSDCNTGNASLWRNVYTDGDGDNHAPNASTTCRGSDISGYAASPSSTSDCDDSCSTCYPGSGSWAGIDGKDQDCDGSIDENNDVSTTCANAGQWVYLTAFSGINLTDQCNSVCGGTGTVTCTNIQSKADGSVTWYWHLCRALNSGGASPSQDACRISGSDTTKCACTNQYR